MRPLASVKVFLAEADRTATTGGDGSYLMPGVPAGRYSLVANRVGYVPITEEVDLGRAAAGSRSGGAGGRAVVELDLTLHVAPFSVEPITVTATRTPLISDRSPLPATALSGDALRQNLSVSLAHTVDHLAGVHTLSTGEEIGKPVIRGLAGSGVLVLDDGHRVEDYSWSDEDGPSVDPVGAERIELIRGPASLIYGADAIGGVLQVIPPDLPEAGNGASLRRGWFRGSGASNSHGVGGTLCMEGAGGPLGWRLLGTGRFAEAIHTPEGELDNTGFSSLNGEGSIGLHGAGGKATLRLVHYGGEFKLLEAGGPPPGQVEGQDQGPERKLSDDRVQFNGDTRVGGLRLEARAQFQRHVLIELSDELPLLLDSTQALGIAPERTGPAVSEAVAAKEAEAFHLLLDTATLDLLAHHRMGLLQGTFGVSGLLQKNDSKGPIFFVPDADVNSGGGFVLEQATIGRWSLLAGGRIDSRRLTSRSNPAIGHLADQHTYTQVSGDAGIVYRILDPLSFGLNFGRAWRPPTLFELYADGPHIGEARYEIGRADLVSERGWDLDGSLRWHTERSRVELAGFRNRIHRFIFLDPTGETIGGYRVYRYEQADATLQGGEVTAQAQVFGPVTLQARADYVYGKNEELDQPLPAIPPLRVVLGGTCTLRDLGWARRASAGVTMEYDARQTRRTEFDFETGAYTLLGLEGGLERDLGGRSVRIDLKVDNATNRRYKSYLSRYKEFALNPGIDAVLAVTLGLSGEAGPR